MNPYKLKYLVRVSGGASNGEIWFDDYDKIYDYLTVQLHSGHVTIEAAIIGPKSLIPVFTDDGSDAVLCKAKILEVDK